MFFLFILFFFFFGVSLLLLFLFLFLICFILLLFCDHCRTGEAVGLLCVKNVVGKKKKEFSVIIS